jgi:uncharacterized membrane protein (UPF0182 family)
MPKRLALIVVALVLFVGLPRFAEIYTEWLWFGEVGFQGVFLKSLVTKAVLGIAVFAAAFALLFANLRLAVRGPERSYTVFPGGGDIEPIILEQKHLGFLATGLATVVALFVAAIASSQWLVALQFLNGVPFGDADPIFGRDTAFYVFTLPFLDFTRYIGLAVVVLAFIGSTAAYVVTGQLSLTPEGLQVGTSPRQHLAMLIAIVFVLLTAGAYLDMPRTLMTPAGILHGASYVDDVIRLPSLFVLTIVAAGGALAAAYAAMSSTVWPVGAAVAAYLVVLVGGGGVSTLVQQLIVTPDEQSKEAPYIVHNIAATRAAFDLNEIEERSVSGDALLTMSDIEDNAETINNVRLWDHQPLLDTFGQIQAIRTYYEFASVDNDRYVVDGEYRQTMLSARELNSDSLPNRSWVNERLQYTHGFGVAMGPVNEVTQEGLPVLFLRDLPPRSETSLAVKQPSIYFGELSNDYVLINTNTDEFHYPEGEDNVSNRYDGAGGLELGNLFKRLLFSLRFRSYELMVSGQLNADSRVIFHRNISDRLEAIAPFLQYDSDPYLVIADDRLFWIRDAYTLTGNYPYSTPVTNGINYIRNSVKVVIDAYNGTTTFYLADPDDPIAATLSNVFPDFLQPLDSMPEELRSHLRYPEGIFTLQTTMYSTYHMTNPSVFYNREDQWEVPVVDNLQMEPYYTIMRLPGEEKAEFIQMLPFTPRGRNNMAAWMVARSDGAEYGKLMAFQFPKQKLVFGPSQIVNRINQDQEISPQFTLWNQQGSEVIHGTLLVIPIEEALLYIRPMYLRASGGRIPELKQVVVAYQNQIVMEATLDLALDRMFGGEAPTPSASEPTALNADAAPDEPRTSTAPSDVEPSSPLAQQAQQHYAQALQAQRNGDWARYGDEIERLGAVLDQLQTEQ